MFSKEKKKSINDLVNIYKLIFPVLLLLSYFSIINVRFVSAAAYVIGDVSKCVDGTQISTSAITSGNESSFCASHGGYDPRGLSHCTDGTPFTGGPGFNALQFCQSKGSTYAPQTATNPTATPTPGTGDSTYTPNVNAFGDDCGGQTGVNCITKDITIAINVLAAGVGVVTIAMIIVGGIQYSLAADNPQAVQAAKTRIRNAIIALLGFLFLWAFLQWLIPGGAF
jgi:hypothetical protein